MNIPNDLDYQPMWLALTIPSTSTDPAIHLTPISWADFDLYRQRSLQPYSLHGAKSEAQDNGEFLRLLLDATAPDAWRGFERDGQPLPFDKSMLLKVLKRNIELGLRFISELRETIIRLGQAESNEIKN